MKKPKDKIIGVSTILTSKDDNPLVTWIIYLGGKLRIHDMT